MSSLSSSRLRPVIDTIDGLNLASCPLCFARICGPEPVDDHFYLRARNALIAHLLECPQQDHLPHDT